MDVPRHKTGKDTNNTANSNFKAVPPSMKLCLPDKLNPPKEKSRNDGYRSSENLKSLEETIQSGIKVPSVQDNTVKYHHQNDLLAKFNKNIVIT